jgi:hypothetical protein
METTIRIEGAKMMALAQHHPVSESKAYSRLTSAFFIVKL